VVALRDIDNMLRLLEDLLDDTMAPNMPGIITVAG
jgi:hypothetical protein